MIEKIIKVVRQNSEESDYKYWQEQPYQKRLRALEEIREEYNSWRYDNKQRFQRISRIIKQKPS